MAAHFPGAASAYNLRVPEPKSPRLNEIEAALRLFDETTAALAARISRLEEVVIQKQQELVAANAKLSDNVAALDRTTAWLNLLMESVASGVVAVDHLGVVTTCNPAAEEALAGVLPDPIDADWRSAFPDSPLLGVIATGLPAAYERTVAARGGGRRVLAARAAPLRSPEGALIGAVEVFEDVTEVRRLLESVERADRLKQLGEMAAGVAHEIRNPLNGIEGFASLLQRDLPADDKRHRFAAAIVEGVRTLNRTVTSLLEFTNPRRIERRPVPPGELARACIELVQAEQAVHPDLPAVTLELDDRVGDTPVALDGIQLKQVLLNLVQNAVQAVQNGERTGRVRISVVRSDHGIEFLVDDDGPGVPASERQRIFTPFYTTKDHGTGLGLAIAHTVVSLHGGRLTIEDSPLGGARFRITVPM